MRPPGAGMRRDVSGQGFLPTLGLHHLASTLELVGVEVRVEEGYQNPLEHLARTAIAFRPDVVGVYVVTPLWATARALIGRLAESLDPETRFAVGGPHTKVRGQRLTDECPTIDRVFVGASEHAFAAWVTGREPPARSRQRANGHPPGWSRRLVGRVPWERSIPNLMFADEPRFATSVTTLGCSLGCAYCVVPGASGSRRARSNDELMEELHALEHDAGIRSVSFMDDQSVFVQPSRRSQALLERMIDSGS